MFRKLILLALILVSFNQMATLSQAQETPAIHPVIQAYVNTFNVSVEEATHRLNLQNEMGNLIAHIAENEPSYAGGWIQHQPEFGMVVRFVDDNPEARLAPYLIDVVWAEQVSALPATHTDEQLLAIQEQIIALASEITIPFETATSFQDNNVVVYTPNTDGWLADLQSLSHARIALADIQLVEQDGLSEPINFLDGGEATSNCTNGFTVKNKVTGVPYVVTAGHCSDPLSHDGKPLGKILFENDPTMNSIVPQPYGTDMDIQINAGLYGGHSLRNQIQITLDNGSQQNHDVVSYSTKYGTVGDWVCKSGRTTQQTCGTITSISFAPSSWSARYVKVERFAGTTYPMACPGDSGSPVYKTVNNGVSAMGIVATSPDASVCDTTTSFFTYTSIDEIERAGYRIVTNNVPAYPHYVHQQVWYSASICNEHTALVVDNSGNASADADWSVVAPRACLGVAAPGSGSNVQSYTTYVTGNYLNEAMWRDNKGYVRRIPLNADGTVNWGAAPAWGNPCCVNNSNPPQEQAAYVVNNTFFQHVWWSDGTCREYWAPLDSAGNPIWNPNNERACQTTKPATGWVQSYTTYATQGYLYEAMWQNNLGYVRAIPIVNGSADWNSAPNWTQCCSTNPPKEQGAYILRHP